MKRRMKRRQFLKSVFGVAAGAVVVPSIVKAKVKDPTVKSPKDWTANDWAEAHNNTVAEINSFPEYPLGTRKGGRMYVKAAEDINVGDAVKIDR